MMSGNFERKFIKAALQRFRAPARIRAFQRDEEGSIILFALCMLILMLWGGGIAVDMMRLEAQRTHLQNTLDRAVLAAADLTQDEDATAVVNDYFDKAGLSGYLTDVSVNVPDTGSNGKSGKGTLSYRKVSATASIPVDTFFMDMLGYDTLYAAAGGAAEQGIEKLEISLVVDVSGSMGWPSSVTGKSKLWDLQEAAKQFGFHMLCNPHAPVSTSGNCNVEQGTVSISLVPYAEQVTVHNDVFDAVNEAEGSRYDISREHRYSACATFDAEDFGTPLLSVSDDIKRTGHFDPESEAGESPDDVICKTDDWRIVRPLIAHHSDLNHLINNLRAGGYTSIDLGMKWGVGLLDPDLRPAMQLLADPSRAGGAVSVDPEFTDRPYDYETGNSMKIVVLMTDGENTTQHYLKDGYRYGDSPVWRYVDNSNKSSYSIYNAATDQYYYTGDGAWYDDAYGKGTEYSVTTVTCKGAWWKGKTCTETTESGTVSTGSIAVQMKYPEVWETFPTEWYAAWDWLEDPVDTHEHDEKNTRLLNICEASKDEGVYIYTIGFETTNATNALLSQCATTPGHHFKSDAVSIYETFAVIASSINKLRLTQ